MPPRWNTTTSTLLFFLTSSEAARTRKDGGSPSASSPIPELFKNSLRVRLMSPHLEFRRGQGHRGHFARTDSRAANAIRRKVDREIHAREQHVGARPSCGHVGETGRRHREEQRLGPRASSAAQRARGGGLAARGAPRTGAELDGVFYFLGP